MSGDHPLKCIDGTKTMTRRVDKLTNELAKSYDHCWVHFDRRGGEWLFKGRSRVSDLIETFVLKCPYGGVGDRLWVRETTLWDFHGFHSYWADYIRYGLTDILAGEKEGRYWKKPSIHMPRFLSRILLEITEVRAERLQEISLEDIKAEGIEVSIGVSPTWDNYIKRFKELWDSLNAKRGYGWETNPWVWVISFRLLEGKP